MNRRWHRIGLLALLALGVCSRSPGNPVEDGQGTYLGVLFAPVPEVLYDQLPQLPREQGVVITRVLTGSPAAKVDLRRHDILLSYDGKAVQDCEHLARLIRDDKPGRKFNVTYLRAGHTATATVTLANGPALLLADAKPGAGHVRVSNKPGSPAPVNVSAALLDKGRMKVVIEYTPEGSDKTKTVTWEGDQAELDAALRALPERERHLARHALDRLRALSPPKSTTVR